MSFEVGKPGDMYTPELWQMVCCRYYTVGRFVAGKRVLEVGCGTGRGLGYLSSRAREVVGGDLSEDNLSYAREHYGDRVKLLLLDARCIPFRDNSFDVILSMEVIQYLPDLEGFLSESRRVLNEEGVLIFCLPNPDIPGFYPSAESRRHYSVPELAALCAGHGFTAEFFGAFPVMGRPFWAGLRSFMIVYTGRILNKLPGGKRIREFLGKIFLDRNIVGKAELEDSDIDAAACALTSLSADSPDRRHKILYIIARLLPGDQTDENR